MNRRDWLVSAGALAATNLLFVSPVVAAPSVKNFGWLPGKKSPARILTDGIGDGKRAFLWKFFEQAIGGPLQPHFQKYGTCVAEATAKATDVLMATDIYGRQEHEKWIAMSSVVANYCFGRVEVANNPGRWDGSRCEWSAQALKQFGVLHRINYSEHGIDLTNDDPDLTREWMLTGVPDQLEPIAKEHPVQNWFRISTWPEARDQLYRGNTITVGSTYAVYGERDADGFSSLIRGRGRPVWNHAWCAIGMIDEQRPGVLILNSHGKNWISGPRPYEIPEGSFFLSPQDFVDLVGEGESIVLSNYVGHKAPPPRHRFY